MTIRHLTIFVAVADQGSMSAAAASLYLSQPTVSQAIRELEKHYNGLLFERLGKKLYLTERGRLSGSPEAYAGEVFDTLWREGADTTAVHALHKDTERMLGHIGWCWICL